VRKTLVQDGFMFFDGNTLEIEYEKPQLIKVISLFFVALISSSVLFLFDFSNQRMGVLRFIYSIPISRIVFRSCALLGVFISLLSIVYYTNTYFTEKIMLRVDEIGIKFNSGYSSIGVVYWKDIVDITITSNPVGGLSSTVYKSLVVTFRRYEYYSKMLPKPFQMINKLFRGLPGDALTIPFSITSIEPEAVLPKIITLRKKHSVEAFIGIPSVQWVRVPTEPDGLDTVKVVQ
jgi:hypothetical protein